MPSELLKLEDVTDEAEDENDEVGAAAVVFAVVDLDDVVDDNSAEEVDIVTDRSEVESLTWPDRTAVTRSTWVSAALLLIFCLPPLFQGYQD